MLKIWLQQQGAAEIGSHAEAKAAALIARTCALIEEREPRRVAPAHRQYKRVVRQPYGDA